MRRIVPGLAALLWAVALPAANNLQFGPPPAWVRPVTLPPPGTATPAAFKVLLLDHQVELTPNTVSYYLESVSRVQTPQGLTALGTLSLAWNPDTDVLIVHKVHIIRDGKVIDVLASGQKFTIAKRETNLAYATLDDTLTAILQPTDLQVGDILDVAYTLEHTDPVLAGHPMAQVEVPPGLPVSELDIRVQWPISEPIRWHATQGLKDVHSFHDGDFSGIRLTMRHVQPVIQPKGAPLRFLVDRRIDLTSFHSWAQLSSLFAPLFRKAQTLQPDSPLQSQIARIRAATGDPKQRAAMALRLVENEVRYVFLDLNQGGLVPASADLTWSRRFGDCKAKTALLLALLHGLKIDAQPVLVNTILGDGLNKRLPMMLFNHVLVRANIEGKTYWLDGTRLGDRNLGHLHTPYDHWGLPLKASGAQLVEMVPQPLTQPLVRTAVRIDASAGVMDPAPFHVETTLRGDAGLLMKLQFANMTAAQSNAALRQYWSGQYDFVHVESVSATYDERSHEERFSMDGTAKMGWSRGQYEADILGMGYRADFEREPGPNPDAPYAVAYPFFKLVTETITLPDNGKGFSLSGSDIDRTVAGIEYKRHAGIANGVFTATSSQRSVATEFAASEAAQDQKALRHLDRSKLYLEVPTGQIPSAAQLGWGLPKSNDSAADFVKSGAILLAHGELDAAVTDLDTALEFDSRDAQALAMRGYIETEEDHDQRAGRDFNAALAADPKNGMAFSGRGAMALDTGHDRQAIRDFSIAMADNPMDDMTLELRSLAYLRAGHPDKALADLSAAAKHRPNDVILSIALYRIRSAVLQAKGKTAEALDEAKRLEAAYPRSPLALFSAAAIYRSLHQPLRAHDALHRGLQLSPTPFTYLLRANFRPWTDLAGRSADLEAALNGHPASPSILLRLAQVQEAAGQNDAAIDSLSRALDSIRNAAAIVSVPAQLKMLVPQLLALRAIAYEKSGRKPLASRDFAAARRKATDPLELNNLCWRLATAGVSLQHALADCNAAIAGRPYVAGYLDSRGLVLLKLGHYDQAIASYDSALRLNQELPTSLYGRGICELRQGKVRDGEADIRLARLLSFQVADQFEHYGIRP